MFWQCKLIYALAVYALTLLFCEQTLATPAVAAAADTAISNLYDNLLQREYAGPIVLNHQVERKAQRSPSLRLRFGRRSDPEMEEAIQEVDKRWFGDVNQKPIRSPSLRLRFGRRSDPSVPLRNRLDMLMSNLEGQEIATNDDYQETLDAYERMERKPSARLRWGRSVPFGSEDVNGLDMDDNERDQQRQRADNSILNSLLSAEKLRNMLLTLRQFDTETAAAVSAAAPIDNFDSDNEFEREIRKPAPLRLRWGRSTGGATRGSSPIVGGVLGTDTQQQKKSASQIGVNAEKVQTTKDNQDKE